MRWQAKEFRSSQSAPCAPWGPFPGESEAFKGSVSIDSVVKTTESHASQDWTALSFRNHYSETRLAASGDPRTTPKRVLLPASQPALLPNAFCCQGSQPALLRNSNCCHRVGPYYFETHVIVGAARVPGRSSGVEPCGVSELRPAPPDQLTSSAYVVLLPSQVASAIDASPACT